MGHLFRALHLASELKRRGHLITFLVNEDEIALRILSERGYKPIVVNFQNCSGEWESKLIKNYGFLAWVNDRLDTEGAHVRAIHQFGIPVATFDDSGTGADLVDLHIAAFSFGGHQPGGKKILRGVDYLILNPDLLRYQRLRHRLRSIMVTLGGSDTYGVTVKVVKQLAIRSLGATVVVGPTFRDFEALDAVLSNSFNLRVSVSSMAEEMSMHDLAITGGGITPFEANAAGLPCLVIANEEFEISTGQELERLGGAIFIGHHKAIDFSAIDNRLPLERMSKMGIEKIGLGGLVRVADALEELLK
jgi:hypothetical protein